MAPPESPLTFPLIPLLPLLLLPLYTLAAPAVIPPFHAAVDRAISYLDREEGLLGVCDFFTSSK